jgi:putative tributyrin esterase
LTGEQQLFPTIETSDPRFERDGLRHIVVRSPALGHRADITVFVPAGHPRTRTLLLLLHGVYGSHWSWAQRTGVHLLAQRMIDAAEIEPMVIAMPSDGLWGDGSGYLPHPGSDVERWIVDEVVAATRLSVPCLEVNAQLSIAGFSMGGYGALRLGSRYASRFAAISAHSPITHISQMGNFTSEPLDRYRQLNADSIDPDEDLDPLFWMRKNRLVLPRLRFDCGSSDPLVVGSRALHTSLAADHIPHIYEELPGGHEWSYWEQNVARTLRFVNAPP